MGALPRPDVSAGPRRDLSDALHELHHRAGWPSLRVLAREAGCSHTTVSAVFSSPRLPSWGVLELLVEAMGGDPDEFRDRWVAAGAKTDGAGAAPARPPLAGRRQELATVRRHLESGTGLLLVTGVAGIGKSRLVAGAAESVAPFVATGSCLPLSTEVPLLPVADALRTIYESDDGEWVRGTLAVCPPYVAASLGRLLPELAKEADADSEGDLLQLFSAIAVVLSRLAERRPLALQLEDLHWADSATLDLVEQLVVRPRAARLLGTWRLDDTSTPPAKEEWFVRVRRSGAAVVELSPLTVDETADQLWLLTGTRPDPGQVARIHARSAGQPLFTEHLATQAGDDDDLPGLLADLLDRRLGRLSGPSWQVARALGFADRGLPDDVLLRSTALSPDDLVAALHDLRDRRLLSPVRARSEVQLSHPLLAEAVRRRAMPGEEVDQHRSLAAALASSADAVAAEVAVHWEAAGDRTEELAWRIAAARESAARLAPAQEADHWLRTIELWPEDGSVHGTPVLDRTRATFHAMDALLLSEQIDRTDALVASMMPQLEEMEPRDAAELLMTAGICEGEFRSVEEGFVLMQRAITILETLGPSRDLVVALRLHADTLVDLGRLEEATALHERAWQVNRTVGDVQQERALMAERAWHLFEAGRRREAVDMVTAATVIHAPVPDPFDDLTIAKHHADLLVESGATASDVVAAARRGLAVVEECAIESGDVGWLWFDMSCALARSGDVAGAAELIDPLTEVEIASAPHPVEIARADLDIRRGRLEDARARVEGSQGRPAFSMDVRSKWRGLRTEVELWDGHPSRALETVGTLLDEVVLMDEVVYAARYFILVARAAADASDVEGDSSEVRRRRVRRLQALQARAVREPMAHDPGHAATWVAELARIDGTATVEHWAKAATEWDRLVRPHDAAYSRWRAAQVALATGQGTAAARLLRRATADAGEHVPLRQVIEATTARHG